MPMVKRRSRRDRDRAIDEAVALEEFRAMTRPRTPAEALRSLAKLNGLDGRLVTTDRHMQRWALGQGTGLPDPDRALYRPTRLTPLALDVEIATDRVIQTSPPEWRRFAHRWYRSDCSVDQLAMEFDMSRDRLFVERRIVLAYLLGRLLGVGITLTIYD